MLRSLRPSLKRASARWSLFLACLALGMNLLSAAAVSLPALAGGEALLGVVCSSHGLVEPRRNDSAPASKHGGDHQCCKLCAVGAPLAAALPALASFTPPLLSRQLPRLSHRTAAVAAVSAHRPRGPPLV